nr:endothelin-converting enzyme 1-like [Dermacentor andersoni]
MDYIQTSKYWKRWLSLSRVRGASFKYARSLYDAYGAYSTPSQHINNLLRHERALLEMLSHAYRERNAVVLRLPLRDMALLTPNLSAATWLSYLNAHLSPHVLQPDDRLLLVDTVLGRTFNAVFSSFQIGTLLELFGWWFVQQMSFALSRKASLAVYGSVDAVRRYRAAHCYSFAEARFREPLQFVRAAAMVTQGRSVGAATADVFVQVQGAALRLIRSAPWLDDRARAEATAIVNRTELMPKVWLSVGTRSQVATENQVRSYQDAFPSHVTSAFSGWLESARIHKMASPSWPLNDSLLHLHGRFSYMTYQNYWCNTLYVHMAAVAPPIFNTAGPDSLNYGGLGFVIARELIRALDAKRGSFLDGDRRIRSWMSPRSRKALQEKATCPGGQEALMEIAATEIALEAYRAASRSVIPGDLGTRSTRRRGIASGSGVAVITEDMLFFLAMGRSQCGAYPPSLRFLRHVEEFSRVFSCSPGSRMNPPQKCSFFF